MKRDSQTVTVVVRDRGNTAVYSSALVGSRAICREVSEQNGVLVEFSGWNLPLSLPREVSHSIFRVVPEALRNAVKYSGQKYFQVRLQEI